MSELQDDLAYVIGDTATERAIAALLAHAAREDVVERCAEEAWHVFASTPINPDAPVHKREPRDYRGFRDLPDEMKEDMRAMTKAALAAFLQDEGGKT